ncbi:DUF6879 family protein [Streptomyces gamaensis]|uniref:DUF6879 family protein n=1 Tax=Streptomyces gamaensis TaxID=1763542 RepID=A0ABW0ZA55_9ACTN
MAAAAARSTLFEGGLPGFPVIGNVAVSERVRWLPRRRASDIALPGNEYWLFDDHLVRFNHFTGDGADAGFECTEDQTVIELCANDFEAVWERSIPHE